MLKVRAFIGAGLAMAFVWAAPVQAADDLTSRLQTCRTIANVDARAQCYDRVVDSMTAPAAPTAAAPPAAPAPPARAAAAPPPPPPPAAAQAPAQQFGQDSLPRERQPKLDNPEPESMSAKVVAIGNDAAGKALVTLDNGQVWRHLESDRLRLKAGDGVAIKRGFMGNYMMVPDGLNRSYRVARAR